MHRDKGREGEGKLTPLPLSSSSLLHHCHSPVPPKSAVRMQRLSKNRCMGAQLSCCGSRVHPPSSCQSKAYVLCDHLKHSKVLPGTRAHGMHGKDTKGGEAEAALAMLRGLAPVEDAYAALGVLGKVAVWVCFLWVMSC